MHLIVLLAIVLLLTIGFFISLWKKSKRFDIEFDELEAAQSMNKTPNYNQNYGLRAWQAAGIIPTAYPSGAYPKPSATAISSSYVIKSPKTERDLERESRIKVQNLIRKEITSVLITAFPDQFDEENVEKLFNEIDGDEDQKIANLLKRLGYDTEEEKDTIEQ